MESNVKNWMVSAQPDLHSECVNRHLIAYSDKYLEKAKMAAMLSAFDSGLYLEGPTNRWTISHPNILDVLETLWKTKTKAQLIEAVSSRFDVSTVGTTTDIISAVIKQIKKELAQVNDPMKAPTFFKGTIDEANAEEDEEDDDFNMNQPFNRSPSISSTASFQPRSPKDSKMSGTETSPPRKGFQGIFGKFGHGSGDNTSQLARSISAQRSGNGVNAAGTSTSIPPAVENRSSAVVEGHQIGLVHLGTSTSPPESSSNVTGGANKVETSTPTSLPIKNSVSNNPSNVPYGGDASTFGATRTGTANHPSSVIGGGAQVGSASGTDTGVLRSAPGLNPEQVRALLLRSKAGQDEKPRFDSPSATSPPISNDVPGEKSFYHEVALYAEHLSYVNQGLAVLLTNPEIKVLDHSQLVDQARMRMNEIRDEVETRKRARQLAMDEYKIAVDVSVRSREVEIQKRAGAEEASLTLDRCVTQWEQLCVEFVNMLSISRG